jgi:aldose 1-epimerase
MEEGYPGNLEVTIDCSLNNANELKLAYRATTDRPTIVNLTNHSYFNLAGAGRVPVLDHQLMLNADRFLPVDSTLIPTGELRPVEGTPFDFREPTRIGLRIEADNRQLQYGGGYDHCWVINGQSGQLRPAARVHEPESGRVLELETTEPGLQFYSGNFLDGSIQGRDSVTYDYRHGLCLEPEHFPDSPNRPGFPSVVLQPGEEYETVTVYRFSAE